MHWTDDDYDDLDDVDDVNVIGGDDNGERVGGAAGGAVRMII